MAEEVKMTKDNMDIWFEKQGYDKVSESTVATIYEKKSDDRSVLLTIVNNTRLQSNIPDYFKYSVSAKVVDVNGYAIPTCITNDILEHLQTKANILMKKFMQDAIKTEYRHIPSHKPLGDCSGFKG